MKSFKSSFLDKNNDLNNLKKQLEKISINMNNLNQLINKIDDKVKSDNEIKYIEEFNIPKI